MASPFPRDYEIRADGIFPARSDQPQGNGRQFYHAKKCESSTFSLFLEANIELKAFFSSPDG
jgi:hypothetical protein